MWGTGCAKKPFRGGRSDLGVGRGEKGMNEGVGIGDREAGAGRGNQVRLESLRRRPRAQARGS